MIVTRRIGLRIALIVLTAVILQVSFFSYLQILGATPNIVGVAVVSLGLLGGGVVGAVCGFAAGFLLDSLLLQTLGVSSLVLLSIGYLAGRYREGVEITNWLIPPLLAGGFTLLGAAGFAAVQLMLGVDAAVSVAFVREIVVQGLLAVLLATAIYPLLRRILAPALIDYAPSRRLLVPGPRRSRMRRKIASNGSRSGAASRHGRGPVRRRRRSSVRRPPVRGGTQR
jgi:rod shape-determining protein MreD